MKSNGYSSVNEYIQDAKGLWSGYPNLLTGETPCGHAVNGSDSTNIVGSKQKAHLASQTGT
jgi:hypothetical protein